MKTKSKEKVLLVGVTGSFGSGKTAAARMLRGLGASCLDADRIYHQLIRPGTLVYKRIVSVFSRQILKRNRQIDRKKLAKMVFSNKGALKRLSQITHPAVIKEIKLILIKLKKHKKNKVIVIDAPLLIEAGLTGMLDKLIVVNLNKKNQLLRCRKHRQMSDFEIIKRVRSQAPLRKKLKLADFIIDNNGTLKQTQKQVSVIWKKLKRR